MMMHKALIPLLVAFSIIPARAQNLIRNGSFEQRDQHKAELPDFWSATASQNDSPLEFTGEHYQGATSALLVGDGKPHACQQAVAGTEAHRFTLSAMVRAEDATIAPDGHAELQGRVIYQGRPAADSMTFSAKLPPGSYDWNRISVTAVCNHSEPVEQILVTISGKLSAGRMLVDQVDLSENDRLTPAGQLANKVSDLQKQLDRVGDVDATIAEARSHLKSAADAIAAPSPDLPKATEQWVQAAQSLSHAAWAAMYPDAMPKSAVEARMIYHGQDIKQEIVDRNIKTLEAANANGALLSLGYWGMACYRSDLLPMQPGYDKFDGLKYFIGQAHQRHIKVFGYIAALAGTSSPSQDPKSIDQLHPEWFAKSPDPNMPHFPDPANPQVVDFLVKVYSELAQKYELDGIGLDYLRYPLPNALNYDENNRQRIRSRCGIDISVDSDFWADPEKSAKVRAYRSDVIGDLARQVRDAVKSARPGVCTIACLISDPSDAATYGQDWPVSSKLLDYASPMNYDDVSADAPLVARQRSIFEKNHVAFIPSIGGMPEVQQSWTISTWANRVAIQRKSGCDGMIVYRIAELDPAVAAFFGKGAYFGQAQFPQPRNK